MGGEWGVGMGGWWGMRVGVFWLLVGKRGNKTGNGVGLDFIEGKEDPMGFGYIYIYIYIFYICRN